MTTTAAKPGRNDPCSCGSGKKYKRCCGALDVETEDAASRFFGIAAVLVVLMLIGGAWVFGQAFFSADGRATSGQQRGGFRPSSGAAAAVPRDAPVRGALEGLRASEMDAARQKAAAPPPPPPPSPK